MTAVTDILGCAWKTKKKKVEVAETEEAEPLYLYQAKDSFGLIDLTMTRFQCVVSST